ncbi:MAG: TldD/PmbA family protein [Prolixibacteraceae bacterium]|jgi:TldD protein|nr:TldD/PmbA family protein [Prolixibacteraceae bacterium]MBT6998878.1 TldD/PmbA family protein [Prolixibacteraceae bacterium]MBT7394658.1 TldD/PmbA family protein [Prolixibacteraceae bacterium]
MKKYVVSDIPRRDFLKMSLKGGLVFAASPAILSSLTSCGSESVSEATGMSIDPAILKKVIGKALEKGGDFADVYLENRVSRQIVMEESKFKNGLYGVSQGAGVRVISGNKTGYAYSDEITEEKLLRAAEVASYVARNGSAVTPVDINKAERKSYITVEQPLAEIADSRRIEIIQRANDAAMSYNPLIKMASVDYYDEIRSRVIANSEGIYLQDENPLMFFIVQTMSDNGKARHMSRERLSKHSGFEMFDKFSPEEVAEKAAREAVAMLDAEAAPAGIMDVVMMNGWGGVLVHEAVGHPLEADNISKGIGAFTGKLGQKVASDVFTMVDDGTIPNARGTISFDDEGTQAKRNVLIENGVLNGYMTDVLSAKQLGMERTGNGRRESFRYIPIPRMTNTFIENGESEPADILASTKKGIYVQSLSGGSVNPVTGVFNFTCREAYLVENGKKTKPVKGATLIGSCLDVISNIDAVGNDLDFGPGICGKGQAAEVDAGQPTVRIRGINVGGSRS